MKVLFKVTVLCGLLALSGCTGLFESRTCGIRNSQWERMSLAEQMDVTKAYHEKERLADQLKVNKLLAKQQQKLADARKDNEKAQKSRIEEEREAIKKQQEKIDLDLKLKKQAYAHEELAEVQGLN